MDVAAVTQLISNVGFPIVACIYMFKNQLQLTNTITELSSTLKAIDARLQVLETAGK